jgi:phosphoribosylglycinamide formyltransferase-1
MTGPFRVGFCVSGQGRLFRAAAERLDATRIAPACVVLDETAAPELEAFCAERGIPVTRLDSADRAVFDRDLETTLAGARLDLLVLTFNKVVPPAVVSAYAGRTVNVHMSLLPAYKGFRALERAIADGSRFAGATIHEVTNDPDAGPIVAQCVVGLRRDDTTDSAGRRLFPLLRLAYLQVIEWYAAGRVSHDAEGRAWVENAVYGELPISPAVENGFPE